MKNPLWSAIYDLFQDIDVFLKTGELKGPAPSTGYRPTTTVRPVAKTQSLQVEGIRAAFDATGDMLAARAAIRGRLEVLRASLAATLTERETYLVLFPAVVFSDEMVMQKFPELAKAWPPLQKELFRIDNGGEVFYETLDDLLRKPETLPFIYEVYFLCISYGFRGKYADNLAKINEYKAKLEAKIPLPAIETAKVETGPDVIRPERFPIWSYAAAALFLAASYACLYLIASL